MNDAFFFEVDADCRYEFVFKGSVGVLIKQGSFTDARISEAQEFDEIIVVGRLGQRHRWRTVIHFRKAM